VNLIIFDDPKKVKESLLLCSDPSYVLVISLERAYVNFKALCLHKQHAVVVGNENILIITLQPQHFTQLQLLNNLAMMNSDYTLCLHTYGDMAVRENTSVLKFIAYESLSLYMDDASIEAVNLYLEKKDAD